MTYDRLNALGLQTGTDKSSSHHDFLRHYERHLSGAHIKRLLEIGVYDGASLKMWQAFLPDAEIIGVDIDPRAIVHQSERVRVEISDQSDVMALSRIALRYAPFDVVIDDGSHVWSHQILAFETLFPFVALGGTYIIEDIDTSFGHFVGDYGRESTISAAQYVTKLTNYVMGAAAARPECDTDLRIRQFARSIDSITLINRSVLIQAK